MPKKRLSRDQKRKQKLRKKRRTGRAGPRKKYRTEKYIMTIMRAEVGIYETFRMTERQLTDGEVRLALRLALRRHQDGSPFVWELPGNPGTSSFYPNAEVEFDFVGANGFPGTTATSFFSSRSSANSTDPTPTPMTW